MQEVDDFEEEEDEEEDDEVKDVAKDVDYVHTNALEVTIMKENSDKALMCVPETVITFNVLNHKK